jgi:hypothetical protein
MNIIKILIFIFYGIVLKLYDDCVDNPNFGKCVGEFYIEQLKSLIIFFLALTGLYEPYYVVIAFILQLIVIKDLDNSFWLSYFLCSILICLITFNNLTYDLFTILLLLSQIPIAIIDITFFSEDSSYKKYIWRGILGIIYILYLIVAFMMPAYYNEFFVYYCINVVAYGLTMICSRYFMYLNNPTKIKKQTKKLTKKIKSKKEPIM